MAKKDKKVKIRILPGRGIGGVGDAGDTGWMSQAEADQYVKEGYVEILTNEAEVVPSVAADAETNEAQLSLVAQEEVPAEETHDHDVMKPESKRD